MKSKYLAVLSDRDRPVFISRLFLISLMIFGANSTVYAVDAKVYPGTMCVRYSGAPASYNRHGAVANRSSTERLKVACPVIHDNAGSNVNSGWVRVVDQNTNKSIRCRLFSFFKANGIQFINRSSLMKSANGDPVMLSFNGNLDTESADHYVYRCGIPPRDQNTNRRSYIDSYQVVEFD